MDGSALLPAVTYLPATRAIDYAEERRCRSRLVRHWAPDVPSLRIVESQKQWNAKDSVIRWIAPESRQAAVSPSSPTAAKTGTLSPPMMLPSSGGKQPWTAYPSLGSAWPAIELPDGRLRM